MEVEADYARFFRRAPRLDKRQFDLPGFVLARLRARASRLANGSAGTRAPSPTCSSQPAGVQDREPDYGRLLSAIVLEA